MKKITFVFLFLIGGMVSSYAQFSENFDAGTTIPAGWSVINGGDASTWVVGTPATLTAHSGTNVAKIIYNSTVAHDDYLVTPQFTVTGGVSDFLSLWAKSRSTFYQEKFDVLLSTTGTATTDFTTTLATDVAPPTAWTVFNYDLTAYAGQTVYIAFRSTTLDQFELDLDDIAVGALPNPLDYVNLQWPPSATFTQGGSVTVYGQVYEAGLTDVTSGQAPGIQAWVGYSATNTNPNTWTNWTAATFNVEVGNNDEYQAIIGSTLVPGTYYYATRFVQGNGAYVYGGIDASNNGSFWDGTTYLSGVLTVTQPPPPANDECSSAVSLTVNPDYLCGTVTPGTVLGATASAVDAAACAGTEDDDVWFSFEATATSHKISILNASGSATDMYHSLWTGSDCNSLTLVPGSCSDADNSFPSSLSIGQTYFLRVNTYTATTGQNTTFNVCIGSPPPPPANDDCTGAIPLTVNPDYSCAAVTAGTVAGATASSVDDTACFGSEDDDVWYSFEATATTHRISLTGVTGSATDMFHSLWTGSDCGSLTLFPGSCSDGDTSNPSGLSIGQTYFVRVNTYTATAGQDTSFNICIGTPPPPPLNDDCSGAIDITCGSTTLGTTEGTTNENMPVCGIANVTTQNTAGVWYKYTGDGSDVTVTTCSPTITTGDSRLAVYTGACGSLTCIGGNDDLQTAGCSTNTVASGVTFSTVIGTDYYILVYAYTSNALNFALTVNCTTACSPVTGNDECSTALPLTLGSTVVGTDNLCSTASLDVTYPTCGNQFLTYYDTWYWFDSGSSTDFTISLDNQTGTNGFALYSGSCGNLTMVPASCTTTGADVAITGLATASTYYLRVFSTTIGTRGSYDLTVSETLGTGSFDNGSFTYYPNPVKNVLNLSYNQAISNVEVFNLLGQKVTSDKFNANEAQVDMSHLSAGAYMVKVTSEGQVKTIKVIKQ